MNDFFNDLLDPDKAQQYIIQGSDQWDQIRCGRFTASEIHKLMDSGKREMTTAELKARPKDGPGSGTKLISDPAIISDKAMTYIKQKVAETLTGQLDTQDYAWPLVRGKEMEPEAVECFERITGLECEEIGFCPYTDHAGGSPDRLVQDGNILEVKCPAYSRNQVDYLLLNDRWDLKRMHPDYYWQIQANLLFTNRPICYFATYDPRFKSDKLKMFIMKIAAVSEDQDLIIQKIAIATREKLQLISLIA